MLCCLACDVLVISILDIIIKDVALSPSGGTVVPDLPDRRPYC